MGGGDREYMMEVCQAVNLVYTTKQNKTKDLVLNKVEGKTNTKAGCLICPYAHIHFHTHKHKHKNDTESDHISR